MLIAGSITALLLACAWFVWALAVFVFPPQPALRQADTVVSLSPPAERLPAALRFFGSGAAPRLWVSYVPVDSAVPSDRRLIADTCSADAPSRSQTTCFEPITNDTIGEARAVAELMKQDDVVSVIIVTHTSHAARARFIFEHCLPQGTDVQVAMIDEPNDPVYVLGRMLYETASYAKAAVDVLGCID